MPDEAATKKVFVVKLADGSVFKIVLGKPETTAEQAQLPKNRAEPINRKFNMASLTLKFGLLSINYWRQSRLQTGCVRSVP